MKYIDKIAKNTMQSNKLEQEYNGSCPTLQEIDLQAFWKLLWHDQSRNGCRNCSQHIACAICKKKKQWSKIKIEKKRQAYFFLGWKSGKTHAHLVHGLVAKKALGSQITAIYMW